MDSFSDPQYSKVHALAIGLLEGTLSREEQRELQTLILENPAARRAYLEYLQESACLRWLCVEEFPDLVALANRSQDHAGPQRSARRILGVLFGSGLACLLIALAAAWWYSGNMRGAKHPELQDPTVAKSVPNEAAIGEAPEFASSNAVAGARPEVATITGLGAIRWHASSGARQVLSRCSIGDRLRLRDGSAVLTFDAGAQVTVFGPADFEITSATSIKCRRGRVTTLVDHRGRGFSIETPQAKVVDLGTQFGLQISDKGETEVVVFQGSIDLSYAPRADATDASGRRMQQGDGLLLKNSGEIERLVSVQRNSFMSTPNVAGLRPVEPVIGDVRDNIRKADSIKSYQIVRGGLEDDCLAFVDRNHQWNAVDTKGLPPFLEGADYIMPFNNDKFVKGLELKVKLLRPATLYVFLDNNMAVPSWLKNEFTDTGMDIGLDCAKTEWHKDHSLGVGSGKSIDFKFSIWKREVKTAGAVTLGGIEQAPAIRSQGFNMYGIAATVAEGLSIEPQVSKRIK
jgi:ferric-dicitrate binding protein FerR (iron transport regulator)